MANSPGTLSGTLVIQRALELTFTKYPMLAMISMGFRDLDGRASQMNLNQSAVSRLQTIPAVSNFGDAAADYNTTDVSITLSGFKQVLHTFTAAESNSTDRKFIDESAKPMSIAIAKHIIASVANLWTRENFATELEVASGWTRSNTLNPLAKLLDAAGVPEGDRFGVLGLDPYYALLDDPLVVAALNNPSNGDAIRLGLLPDVSGLELGKYADLPSNNGTEADITGTASTNLIVHTGHTFSDGDRIQFTELTGGTGLSEDTVYFVISAASNQYQVAETAGGAAVTFSTNITAGKVQSAENLIGFAGAPDSTAYVARPPKNPEELMPNAKFPGVIGYVTEPTTGFTVMVNQWIGDDLTCNNRLLWLEGYAKGNGAHGARLVSQN